MSHLPSLPENAHLIQDVWPTFFKGVPQLLALIDETMTGVSEVPIGERELIFAYVSALNKCPFCFNAHSAFAEQYGVAQHDVERLSDLDDPTDDPRLIPVMALTRKLTKEPYAVNKGDTSAVLAQGWSEQAVADMISVVSLSNLLTRIVAGMGVAPHEDSFTEMRQMFRAQSLEDRRDAEKDAQGQPKYVHFITGAENS